MRRAGIGLAVVLVAAAIGAAGAAVLLADSDDNSDDDVASTTATTPDRDDDTTTTAVGPLVFEASGVPFTFDYPANFAAVPPADLPPGYIAILGIDPLNFIDVRLTAEAELTDDQLIDDIGATLTRPGLDVLNQTSARAAGITFITFNVTDTTGDTPTQSTLRFFRAGGKTWELACQHDDTGRTTIEPACDDMLDTFELAG